MDKKNKLQQVLSLLSCLLIIVSLTVLKQARIFGHDLTSETPTAMSAKHSRATTETLSTNATSSAKKNAIRVLDDGSVVVNTTDIAHDITGYGGRVPLEITIKDGIIRSIKALKNQESETFFNKASALFAKWTGKSVDEAMAMKVDAVSGATFSSRAIMANVQRGLQYASRTENVTTSNNEDMEDATHENSLAIKDIVGLVVALMAAVVPLFVKNHKWHMAQATLNVVVLGFWCGAFLSYTSLISFFANGITGWAFLAVAVMLVTAFVYPLFGKPSYYCTNVCPFGGLQQLASSALRFKLTLSPNTVRQLDTMRQVLWALLMFFIWSGVWCSWIDYEPFTAFLLGSASWVAIAIAVVFVALSFVVTRPYCRFVCPMGTLLKYSQKMS